MKRTTVSRDEIQVFSAIAGRLGSPASAELDFLIFASGVIGAAFTLLPDAVARVRALGYQTHVNNSNGT